MPRHAAFRLSPLLYIVVAALAAHGCGSRAPSEAEASGQTKVTYMMWGSSEEIGFLRKEMAAQFAPAASQRSH